MGPDPSSIGCFCRIPIKGPRFSQNTRIQTKGSVATELIAPVGQKRDKTLEGLLKVSWAVLGGSGVCVCTCLHIHICIYIHIHMYIYQYIYVYV